MFTPQKSNIDTKKTYFKGVHLIQTIILGIHVRFFRRFKLLFHSPWAQVALFLFRILCHDDNDDINCPKKDACCWFLLA